MRKRMLFFLNPKAGHQELRNALLDVLQIFTAGGYDVTVHPTQCPGDLTAQIIDHGEEYDLIVCAGGDGTLNEAISGLMELDRRPPLGYIPAGTVNDVAATLGLSRDPIAAANTIVRGKPQPIDIGSFGPERWFTYVAGFGAFTDVSYETPQQGKRIFGRMAYLANGIKYLSKIKPTRVRFRVNGKVYEDDILLGLVCSTTSVGGFDLKSLMDANLNDGLYEVVLAKKIHSLLDLKYLATLLLKRQFDPKFFYTFQTDRVDFRFLTPVKWTLDGEFGGMHSAVDIQNHRKAVEIIVPTIRAKKKPVVLRLSKRNDG